MSGDIALLLITPAKINLTLRIISRRADGYHEISSIMRAIRLFDEVEIVLRAGRGRETGRPGQTPLIRVSTDNENIPGGAGNLAYRAAEFMLDMHGRKAGCAERRPESILKTPGLIDITLKKNIPAAAGLAGGSADAAAVLLGLAKELEPEAGIDEIAGLGAGLGADVPFCVYACAAANPTLGFAGAGAALAEGIGERISLLTGQGRAFVVLVKPSVEIPTKEAYALFDAHGGDAAADTYSENDFEAVCAEAWPVVGDVLVSLKRICADEGASGVKVQLSGSGPSVFAFLEGDQEEAAERIYTSAKAAFPGMFVYLTETLG